MIKKYDKDGNGSLSQEEFPEDLAIARRVDGRGTTGAIVTFKMFFGMLDLNKDGQLSKAEWEFVSEDDSAAEARPRRPHRHPPGW